MTRTLFTPLLLLLAAISPLSAEHAATNVGPVDQQAIYDFHVANPSRDDGVMSPGCQCRDDLWVISTRRLCCPRNELTASRFQVARWNGEAWTVSNMNEYVASQSDQLATIVYVHGNRMNIQRAVSRGLMLYRSSIHTCDSAQRLRYVIWSWPSEKEGGGPVQDVRSKAQRTDLECGYLAWFLSQIPQHSTVDLIGYSYGSRIITGALQSLQQTAPQQGPKIRAALMAAAVHARWLRSGERHGQAFVRASQVLLMYNPLDPALKLYHVVDPDCEPQALGFCGFTSNFGTLANLQQIDVSRIVGRSHFEMRYYRSPVIMQQLRSFLLRSPAVVPPTNSPLESREQETAADLAEHLSRARTDYAEP